MFKISPIQDKTEQQIYASASGKIMGFSQFELSSEYGFISDLKCAVGYEDYEAMFILGRATMNFIDLCGVHTCRAAEDAGDARLLHAIGFRKKDGYHECDMTGMFDANCSGEGDKNK